MNLPTPETTEKPSFNSKRRIVVIASFFVILVILIGLVFNKQVEKASYNLLGEIFPGSHVKVEGTEVKGFVDGNKVDHLAGVVKNIEPSNIGTRLTIEWEGDYEIVLVDSKAAVYFGPKNTTEKNSDLRQGDVKEIKVNDHVMLGFFKEKSGNERKARIVIVIE